MPISDAGKKRSLRRIWLAHDNLPVLRNAIDQHKDRRALQRFKASTSSRRRPTMLRLDRCLSASDWPHSI